MEVKTLEVKYKWSERWEEMPCKSSDFFPKSMLLY
jgi:hypothetical protein